MAYNQSSNYHPPRRPNYGQPQQAPPPKAYGAYPPQQQYYNGHDQSYDQGYGYPSQQYSGYDDYGYDQNQQQGQYYQDSGAANGYGYTHDQYDQGYPPQDAGRNNYARGGYQQQPNSHMRPNEGYGNAQYDGYDQNERHYDPRYQQRHGRGGHPPPPNGSRMQRPHPANQESRGQPPNPRGQDSRNGYSSEGSGRPSTAHSQNAYDQRNGRGAEPVDKAVRRRPAPQNYAETPQSPPAVQKPKLSAMEEWKAKERAKMHEAASKPKMIPQDNAFPTFSGAQKESKGSKSTRSSEEHSRPSTSNGRHGSRPGSSKNDHHQNPSPPRDAANGQSSQQHSSHRGLQPFSPIHEQPTHETSSHGEWGQQDYAYDQQSHQQESWQTNGYSATSELHEQRRPPVANEVAPQSYRKPLPQPNDRFPAEGRPANSRPPQPSEPWSAQERVASPPHLQYSNAQRPQPQRNGSSGPYTGFNAAPLPNAMHGSEDSRMAPAPESAMYQGSASPQYPQQANAHTYAPNQQSRAQPQAPDAASYSYPEHRQEEILDDLYDDYLGDDHHDTTPAPGPPRNRDEEIEAEMPDFDSAAPGQTSSLQKRQQPAVKQANAAPSSNSQISSNQQANMSAQSLPVQYQKPYANLHETAASSQPELRDVQQNSVGPGHGFVFGVPGEQISTPQQYDDPNQMAPPPNPMAYRPVQSVPAEDMRRGPPMGGPQQLPMRGGPPGDPSQPPRFHPGGRGPLPPPQQRSASARPVMAQAGWSDPGQQPRGPTAPQMRPGPHGMPPPGMQRNGGHPHAPQRAPSAPPGQQAMRGMLPPGAPRNGPPFPQHQMQRQQMPPQGQPNPDSLPHHPAPFRPGLVEQSNPNPPKPAPVRNYENRSSASSHTRQPSTDKPITKAALEQARLDLEASPTSPRLALRYAKKLVEASHVLASEGGRLDPKTTQRNREKYLQDAYKRIKELVRNAYPEAQFYMADCYGSGELGLPVDTKEAFGLYLAAAKGGHPGAAFRTAVSCEVGPEEGGGTRKDHPKAVQWYRRAAALGDVAAMYKLGIVLLRGLLGQPRNVGEALVWLKRAAERADKDNPHPLHELATLYDPANADKDVRAQVAPDEPYALSLFRQAADMGFKRSQFRLGQAYEYGILGLDIDNRASIAWYTKAAAQGEHNAELALSGWYLTGAEGMLEQSDMEAYLWARKAAQSEPPLAKAMFAMGYFAEQGIGCPRNLDEAKRWYGRAASFQFPRALERLEELRKGKNKAMSGKLTRDKKKDEENCVVM